MGKMKTKSSKYAAKTSLTAEMEKELNKQVQMEGKSSFYYLAMASWCETKGYLNAADFLYNHFEEEKNHMMKLFRYINEMGGHAVAPDIKDLKTDYESLRDVFEHILEHEIAVTKSINNIIDFCFQVKDFSTLNFLQWYVNEQREEEALARRTLELFDIIGEEGQGLWLIDQEIGKILKGIEAEQAAEANGGGEAA
jgi:ferritin